MADPPVPSPWPPGTTETAIWFDAAGQQLPGPDGAASGEIEVRFPDGRTQRFYMTTRERPTAA